MMLTLIASGGGALSIGLVFWILMLFWLLFGFWTNYSAAGINYRPLGGTCCCGFCSFCSDGECSAFRSRVEPRAIWTTSSDSLRNYLPLVAALCAH